jgi:hypothetical protein
MPIQAANPPAAHDAAFAMTTTERPSRYPQRRTHHASIAHTHTSIVPQTSQAYNESELPWEEGGHEEGVHEGCVEEGVHEGGVHAMSNRAEGGHHCEAHHTQVASGWVMAEAAKAHTHLLLWVRHALAAADGGSGAAAGGSGAAAGAVNAAVDGCSCSKSTYTGHSTICV